MPGRLSAIQSVLASVHSQELVNLDFLGLGFFPNENRPSILWTGVNGIPNLPALASKIDQSLEKTGISREPRPFSPHLTLARFEPPGIAENLRATVQKNMQRSFGSCAANEFQLIESKFKPSGAEYTTVQTYRFVAAEA